MENLFLLANVTPSRRAFGACIAFSILTSKALKSRRWRGLNRTLRRALSALAVITFVAAAVFLFVAPLD